LCDESSDADACRVFSCVSRFRNDVAVTEVLKKMEDWEFNVFDLARVTNGTAPFFLFFFAFSHFPVCEKWALTHTHNKTINCMLKNEKRKTGRPLFFLGLAFFERHKFKEQFNIDDRKLRSFLNMIEGGYKSVRSTPPSFFPSLLRSVCFLTKICAQTVESVPQQHPRGGRDADDQLLHRSDGHVRLDPGGREVRVHRSVPHPRSGSSGVQQRVLDQHRGSARDPVQRQVGAFFFLSFSSRKTKGKPRRILFEVEMLMEGQKKK
jgi:hypothetical protein